MSGVSRGSFTSHRFKAFVDSIHSKNAQELLLFKTEAEKTADSSNERRLNSMKDYEGTWNSFLNKAVTRTKRPSHETIFGHAEEYRERSEINEALEKCRASEVRCIDNVFYCSLGNDPIGFVEIGTSGLYCKLDAQASLKQGLTFRRSPELARQSRGKLSSKNHSWRDDIYLRDSLNVRSKRVREMLPGVMPPTDYFCIEGIQAPIYPEASPHDPPSV